MNVNPYLLFNGDCEEAFKLYAKVLKGKVEMSMTNEQSPMKDQTPPEWRGKILHARMSVGDKTIMGSDAPPGRYEKPKGFSVTISLNDTAEAERIFAELSQKGEVHMAPQETFWAARFAMFTDRFGTPWMINCEKKM